jgi:hypothetical protein
MIETIYEELKKIGVVNSSNQFSREWLGMEKSYMRCLRAKQRQPSARAMSKCAARLKHHGTALAAHQRSKTAQIGKKLNHLADCCINEIINW